MATTIVTKKGSGAPAASDLVEGELAVDTTNGRLYTENSSAAVVELGSNPSGNITFGDNGKAIFGAGSDLQIYHSGTHSFISDQGTGNMLVLADNFEINSASNTANKITATTSGAVTLFHNNAAKLATSSTGIDVTGVITTDGMTTSADINFGDSDKAVFGAGSDLQIYHNANNSYIQDVGTGKLHITSDGTGVSIDKGTSEVMATFDTDGAVTLYHNALVKLATTSTGIDVTGTATMDGLTASASTADYIASITNSNGTDAGGGLYVSTRWNTAANSVAKFVSNSGSNVVANFAGNGDISFYEDTGTTAKLTWDASAESLNFADNGKATFGAGSDLQIYHDGSHSYVSDQGTGNIKILADDFVLKNSADTETMIQAFTDAAVSLWYDNSAKLTTTATGIDVTGSVTADGLVNNGDVVFSKSSTGVPTLKMSGFAGANSPYGVINFYNEDGSQQGPNNAVQIKALAKNSDGSGGELAFYTSTGTSSEGADAVERMRIDSSGNVGIGTSSPASGLELEGVGNATNVTLDNTTGSTGRSYSIRSGNTGNLDFYDNDATTARLVIDSSGNLLVGKTALNTNTTGLQLESDGYLSACRDGGNVVLVNRKSSDGALVTLQKDGSTVGSIGTLSGTMYIGNGDCNLLLTGATDQMLPVGTAGATKSGQIDLGSSGNLFKDLYLSGGAYLGGTAAANKLDDYEEGTWTPVPARLTGGSITTDGTITATGSYTKVGRQVTIVCNIAITGTITQGTSNTSITGIPFLPITSPRHHASAICSQSALTNNVNDLTGISADYAYNALQTQDANPWVAGSLQLTCTYFTAA